MTRAVLPPRPSHGCLLFQSLVLGFRARVRPAGTVPRMHDDSKSVSSSRVADEACCNAVGFLSDFATFSSPDVMGCDILMEMLRLQKCKLATRMK